MSSIAYTGTVAPEAASLRQEPLTQSTPSSKTAIIHAGDEHCHCAACQWVRQFAQMSISTGEVRRYA